MRIPAVRMAVALAAGTAMLITAACGSSGPSAPKTSAGGGKTTGVHLTLLIGSSGDAETNAVNAAATAWGTKSGNTVTVTPAKDLTLELTQALAGGSPPDLFYVDASKFAGLVKANALAPYGDQLSNKADFYPSLVKSFSDNGKFYCAPKDFSTLALEINTDMWTKAGLTDADIPTNWDQLEAAAKKLTKGGVAGLVFSDTPDGTEFTANSPENLAGLQYVAKLAKEGVLKFPKQTDTGWGGEAIGKNKAAMTIEGNWIVGGVKSDFPKLHYKVVELPAGPKGKATLSFTNCWGIAQKSKNQAAAIDFVKFLTSTDQQIAFAKAFGVMPSVQSAKSQFTSEFPDQQAFVAGADYATGPTSLPGFDQVQKDFDSKILGLSDGSSNPQSMVDDLQKNAEAALKAAG